MVPAVGLHAGHEVIQVVHQEAGELSDQRLWVKVPGQLLAKHVIPQYRGLNLIGINCQLPVVS